MIAISALPLQKPVPQRAGFQAVLAASVTLLLLIFCCSSASADSLPVKVPPFPERAGDVRNPMTWQDLHHVTAPDTDRFDPAEGLQLNLPGGLSGKIIAGPYPYEYGESGYDYPRYRTAKPLAGGIGEIEIDRYFADRYNANNWPEGQCARPRDCPTPTVGYRVVIEGMFYDGRTAFACRDCRNGPWLPNLTLVEGPFAARIVSDHPRRVLIAVETGDEAVCRVKVTGPVEKSVAEKGPGAKRHEIWLDGLLPGQEHAYQVFCEGPTGKVRSGVYTFRTAPSKNSADASVVFAFGSDSREGPAGEAAFMGHNRKTLSRIANDAARRGAELFIFAGDLVNGYTSETEDFRLQLKGWKKTMEGFWRTRPVYPAMGNHEALVRVFDDGTASGVSLDRWPYKKESAEAVFAQEFFNPENGPAPEDPRRPPYTENVYAFQYGPVLFVAFNNNYWWTSNARVADYGGSPEGYVMGDQLTWIEQTLARAEEDRTVRYIFLYAQEPVFPAGGHVKDAMWHHGNNNARAFIKDEDGAVKPAGPGIVEARNRLWKAAAASGKVAAVLVGDEHAYHRLLVTDATPVGIVPADDVDGDGVLDRYSANPEFDRPTWQICAGNAGAPWYNRENTPWPVERYVSRIGYVLFKASPDGVSMTAYAVEGEEVIDHVADLMAVK